VPNLSIKNVPDDVVARLRARARANHRSLQGELLELACRAVATPDAGAVSSNHLRSEPGGGKSIEQIAAEHETRQPQPVVDAPRAAELIRRERDAR
jgi:plasmid stability protein